MFQDGASAQVFSRIFSHLLDVSWGKLEAITPAVFFVIPEIKHLGECVEKAWQLQRRRLVDFKVEFGINSIGELLLADVIDNDSWRILDDAGNYDDKQVYRDGGDLNEVTRKYRLVSGLADRFELPKQSLIFWRGSDKDKLDFYDDLRALYPEAVLEMPIITCSAHKQPAQAYRLLTEAVSKIPDSVIVVFVALSNGAGPMLSANVTVPVMTVPLNYRAFPDDVWSSLRTPSNVPVMTVLEPANAVLAALQILAMRNPAIYATLRLEQEKRLVSL